nr:hypothetical protein [Tanacetum cinerariifolium]
VQVAGSFRLLLVVVWNRVFRAKKVEGVGRGVKEKDLNVVNRKIVKDGVLPPIIVGLNLIASNFKVVMDDFVPYAIGAFDGNALGKSLEDTTLLGSFPPLPTQEITPAGNAPGKSPYANITDKPSGKKLNIHILFTPKGNGIDVVVPMESVRAISDRFANTT